jgi:hypothetical protein
MPEERIPKLIREWIPQERRKRGRHRKTWMEGVQAATTARNLAMAFINWQKHVKGKAVPLQA